MLYQKIEAWTIYISVGYNRYSIIHTSLLGDTRVYIGSHSHRFVAVDLASGDGVWDVLLQDRVESSACLSHCGLYLIVGRSYSVDK